MIKNIDITRLDRGTNVRDENDKEITELAQSIEKVGLLHPLTVRPVAGGRYEIIAGHRRFEALKRLNEPFVSCDILENSISDNEKLTLQVIENVQRKNMSAYELVQVFNDLKAQGHTQKSIAKLFSKSQTWVTNQYQAVEIIERDFEGEALKEQKKKSCAKIKKEAQQRIGGGAINHVCDGFSAVQNGHKYTISCYNFEAESALLDFIEARKK